MTVFPDYTGRKETEERKGTPDPAVCRETTCLAYQDPRDRWGYQERKGSRVGPDSQEYQGVTVRRESQEGAASDACQGRGVRRETGAWMAFPACQGREGPQGLGVRKGLEDSTACREHLEFPVKRVMMALKENLDYKVCLVKTPHGQQTA